MTNYLPSWDFDQFKLDEFFSRSRPSPRTLVMAGWQLTKDLSQLPSAPGVYIIHGGGDGHLDKYLYVGQAGHLRNRLYNHPQWKRACREYAKPAVFYWSFTTVSKRDLLRYECFLIGTTNPAWNFGDVQQTVFEAVRTFDGLWD